MTSRCAASVISSVGSLDQYQELSREDELEQELEQESETVEELDLAAVTAAGIDLLPEMSDDWMAAFR